MDCTIRKLISEVEYYQPKYRYIAGLRYQAPEANQTLIPKRLLKVIEKTGNLEWKIKTLNEREQHYNKVVRIKRRYPMWVECIACKESTAFLTRKRDLHLCDVCKNIRS